MRILGRIITWVLPTPIAVTLPAGTPDGLPTIWGYYGRATTSLAFFRSCPLNNPTRAHRLKSVRAELEHRRTHLKAHQAAVASLKRDMTLLEAAERICTI